MGDPHCRVGGVDALAAGAARAERVDAEVLGVDGDIHLLRLGQHRDGRGRGVDAAACLRRGHALHPVDAALVLELAVHPRAFDQGDHLLDRPDAAFVGRQDVDLPVLALREAGVHPEQNAREQAGLVAAGAGADLQHDVLVVVRILGHQQDPDLGEQILPAGFQLGQLQLGQLQQLGVVGAVGELPGLGDLRHHRLVVAELLHDRLNLGQRLRVRPVPVHVGLHRAVAEQAHQLVVAGLYGLQLVEHGGRNSSETRIGSRAPAALEAGVSRQRNSQRDRKFALAPAELPTRPPGRARSLAASRDRGEKRHLVIVREGGVHTRVLGVDGGGNRVLIDAYTRKLAGQGVPDGADGGAVGNVGRDLSRPHDVAEPGEQPDVDAHGSVSTGGTRPAGLLRAASRRREAFVRFSGPLRQPAGAAGAGLPPTADR